MNTIKRNGYDLYYQWDGKEGAPVLILSHSLGATHQMWDVQVDQLKKHFHILRYDHPGHGKSGLMPRQLAIDDLGQDVLAMMDELQISSAHFCGLSLGGMVGLWLAANSPERFIKIIVSNTTAKIENTTLLKGRIEVIRKEGLAAVTESVITNWFTPGFREKKPGVVSSIKEMLITTQSEGYASMAETVCMLDLRDDLARITLPLMIIYGQHDKATPAAWSFAMKEKIPHAAIRELNAAHLSNIETSDEYTKLVLDFIITD